ncbi:MarR family winged helix-turn-helix transcriptional regulator [uncultured Microbacterium sp.]|uniref:Putative MarR family transcriptional regulator n=1 Tax=uncultured Microbacterium sp. TaxID=191216 RepID=A0A1Y5NYU6_9MICO|nr:MarR family transcriptional regulator [uncultured Microbacterium sp.]SBS71677.1 putative MarR family transcriptional regulator [uncultured Microbacterium sp.]
MDFLHALVRLETTLWSRVEHGLAERGALGLGSLLALRILSRREGAGRVLDVSEELSITVGAASKVVDRLVRGGLVVRRPHPTDGRSSLVSLTPAGDDALTVAGRIAEEQVAAFVGADGLAAIPQLRRLQHLVDGGAAVPA